MEAEGQPEKASKNNQTPFSKFELCSDQAQYLATLLPPGFSLSVCEKTSKRGPKGNRHKDLQKNEEELDKGEESNFPAAGRIKKTPSNMVYNQNLEKDLTIRPQFNRKYTADFVDDELKACPRILSLLKNSRTSIYFREPVDPVALGLPNYF